MALVDIFSSSVLGYFTARGTIGLEVTVGKELSPVSQVKLSMVPTMKATLKRLILSPSMLLWSFNFNS